MAYNLIANTKIAQAVSSVLLNRIIDGVDLDRPLTTKVKPNFNTACWTFKDNQHHIFVGDNVMPYPRMRSDLNDEGQVKMYQALMEHELGHASWTARNFNVMNDMCKRAGAPFELLNIMEDCRIEDKHRKAYGRNLGWKEFVAAPIDDKGSPTSLLFKMIEEETPEVTASSPELYTKVRGYYDRIVQAPNTLALTSIMTDWVKEFGQEQDKDKDQKQGKDSQDQDSSQGGPSCDQGGSSGQGQGAGKPDNKDTKEDEADNKDGKGGKDSKETKADQDKEGAGKEGNDSDGKDGKEGKGGSGKEGKGEGDPDERGVTASRNEMPLGAQLQNDDKKFAEFSEDATSIEDLANPSGSLRVAESKPAAEVVFGHKPLRVEPAEIQAIADLLEKAMIGPARMATTSNSGKRLNPRLLADPLAKPFREKLDPARKRINVALIVDCSGSMGGGPETDAATLVAALHLLNKKGLVEGHVIASTSTNFKVMNVNDPKAAESVQANGSAEGIERTMLHNVPLLQAADAILVFTDGALCDAPIEKDRWTQKGIRTVGLYVGPQEQYESLSKYFNVSIVRDSLKEVAFAVQAQFARAGLSKSNSKESSR